MGAAQGPAAGAARSPVPQFVRFVAASGFAAAMNFGSRLLFSLFLPYSAAIMLAFCVGLGTAFVLGRLFVFLGAANPLREQLFYFVLVNLFGLAQTLLISLALARWLLPALGLTWQSESIAHAVGIAVPIATSYFGHKYFSFAQPRGPRAASDNGH